MKLQSLIKSTIGLLLINAIFAISVDGKTTPSPAAPNLVRVLLDSAAAKQFRPGFATIRAVQPDIQEIWLNDSATIESILHLPKFIHVVSIKPYLPEHSVVFEDIREHINPSLFPKSGIQTLSISQPGPVGDNDSLFKVSEEHLSRWFLLKYSGSITPEIVANYCRKSYEIEAAEPLYPATPQVTPFVPNDSLVPQQYSLPEINAFNAWGVVRCDNSMVVADVDVGVDLTHQDLDSAVWNNPGEIGLDKNGNDKRFNKIDDDSDGFVDDWRGWDFAGATDAFGFPDGDPSISPTTTTNQHGTETTGLLAAMGNNKIGIAGVAFGAKFIPVKVAPDDDNTMFYAFPGIVFAADHGARVISCSIGELDHSAADEDVINYAYAKGSVIAVAAGNIEGYPDLYPAAYRNSFSVTSVDKNRQSSGYNFDRNVSVSAPGSYPLTTEPGNQYSSNAAGTSLACPQAAGGIALVFQSAKDGPLNAVYPNMTAGQAMAQLRATTIPMDSDPHPGFNGTGIIDLDSAVSYTSAHALRVESVDILNGTSDGYLAPGQAATLRIHFKNYLAPLANVKASILFLDSNGNQYDAADSGVVHSTVTSLSLGGFATLGESSPDPTLPITVDKTAPSTGSLVLIKLIFSDSEASYTYNDYDYITLTVAATFRDIDTNNVFVSIFNAGAIGHTFDWANENGDGFPTTGDGFGWKASPSGIDTGNRDLLFDGGLMIALDSNRLAEAMNFVQPNLSGFSSGAFVMQPITLPSPGNELTTSFSTTLTDSIDSSSMIVDERAIEFSDRAAADAIILDYNFHGAQNLNAFNAGIYMDWDLGEGGFNNWASFGDSSGETINDSVFIINRLNGGYPVVAMKVIQFPPQSALNYYAIDLNEENSALSAQQLEWDWLTTTNLITPYCDVAVELGATNITVPSSGGVHLTYVIGLGSSEDSARSALARAEALYDGTASVSTPTVQGDGNSPLLDLWPDPADRELNISISSIAPGEMMTMKITDAIGRNIVEAPVANGGEISIENMPSGIYLLEADCQDNRYVRTFVKE